MTIDILTLFPEMFGTCPLNRSSAKQRRAERRFCGGPFDESIVKRAQDKSLVKIKIHNLRNWAVDAYGTVDDKPYGGGVGMVIRPEPVFNAIKALKSSKKTKKNNNLTMKQFNNRIVLLDAGGKLYNQQKAQEFAKFDHLILICGHYEGVDFRVHEHLADEVISIGDYVLTGGEIPAMVIVDSVVRLIPGVLTKKEAIQFESFSNLKFGIWDLKIPKAKLLVEYSQYTRPENFKGYKVPKVLLSGNHAEIKKWRYKQSVSRTKRNRPDLF